MDKPKIYIEPTGNNVSLPSRTLLASLRAGASHHESRDMRHPLGIYNLSVGRICDKVIKGADRLHAYWVNGHLADNGSEIIDYLELVTYAVAEHEDDIKQIAYTFFKTKDESEKNKNIRLLKKQVASLGNEISNFANAIKHSHGRIGLFETEFLHEKERVNLLGFYIEEFYRGAAAPHPNRHKEKNVISVTSWLWNILTYLVEMSEVLSAFLKEIDVVENMKLEASEAKKFRDAALKLARLPLYSFDEEHPFHRVTWNIEVDDKTRAEAEPFVYGSLYRRWSESRNGKFGSWRNTTGGDGITLSFHITVPKKMSIQHWT